MTPNDWWFYFTLNLGIPLPQFYQIRTKQMAFGSLMTLERIAICGMSLFNDKPHEFTFHFVLSASPSPNSLLRNSSCVIALHYHRPDTEYILFVLLPTTVLSDFDFGLVNIRFAIRGSMNTCEWECAC